MSTLLKILNIILCSSLFVLNNFTQEYTQVQRKTNIDNVYPDLFKEILSYLITKKFPNNKHEFNEKYFNNILNLKLANKELKSLIEKIEPKNILEDFEDHLIKLIENSESEIASRSYLAAKIGSKNYFETLEIKDIPENKLDIVTNSFEITLDKKYKDLAFIIFNKLILKNLKKYNNFNICNIDRALKEFGTPEFQESFEKSKKILSLQRSIIKVLSLLICISYIAIIFKHDINFLYSKYITSLPSPFLIPFLLHKIDNNIFSEASNENIIFVGAVIFIFGFNIIFPLLYSIL